MKCSQNIPFAREKTINAILFFAEKINNKTLGKLKMLKLLYLLDFEHFRQTGKSSLGLEYQAWKMGPVAQELFNEFSSPKPDLAMSVRIDNRCAELTDFSSAIEFKCIKSFDKKYFSRRELLIMERLVEFFIELHSNQMTQFTHERNTPWHKVWQKGKGNHHIISYDLSLDAPPLMSDKKSITKEELQEISEIRHDFRQTFGETPCCRTDSALERL